LKGELKMKQADLDSDVKKRLEERKRKNDEFLVTQATGICGGNRELAIQKIQAAKDFLKSPECPSGACLKVDIGMKFIGVVKWAENHTAPTPTPWVFHKRF
jgi:hypothetical protein